MTTIKYVFHVPDTGAHQHVHLTARAKTEYDATREANRHWSPRKIFGLGKWVARPDLGGPDTNGAMYQHYDWVLE